MMNLILVALGGAIGSTARYLLSLIVREVMPHTLWPWGTLVANILGGFLMGLLMGYVWSEGRLVDGTERLRLLLGVGVLGGFTTFSSFSIEAVSMFERRAYTDAAIYVGVSVIGAIGAVWLGLILMRRLMV